MSHLHNDPQQQQQQQAHDTFQGVLDAQFELCDLWSDPDSIVSEVLQGTARLLPALLGLVSTDHSTSSSAASLTASTCALARLTLFEYHDQVQHPSHARAGTTSMTSTVFWSHATTGSASSTANAWLSSDIPTPQPKSRHQDQNAGGERTAETTRPMGKLEIFRGGGGASASASLGAPAALGASVSPLLLPPPSQQLQQRIQCIATRLGKIVAHKLTLEQEQTSHKLLQDRERRLVESQTLAKIGQWELDLTSNTLIWSEGVFEIFRVDPTKFKASYEAFLDAIHPDDRKFVDDSYTNSLKSKESYNIIHRLLFFNNEGEPETRWVNEICRTEYSDKGEPLYSVGIVQDITKLKQAQEMDRLKSAFLANMSHEIRTPLNAVMGYTDLMLMEYNDDLDSCNASTITDMKARCERNREYLKTIRQSGELLMAVVSDILDISKIEAGQLQIDCRPYSPTSVLTLVQTNAKAFQQNVAGKNVELELQSSCHVFHCQNNVSNHHHCYSDNDKDNTNNHDLMEISGRGEQTLVQHHEHDHEAHQAMVMGDPARIQQVLTNLLVNAIKFTSAHEGEGRVGVKGKVEYGVKLVEQIVKDMDGDDNNEDGDGEGTKRTMMEFYVTDNGVGIPEEKQETIFEAFRQVHPSRDSHELGGTGLGLTISKRLVEMMGGEMRLWSSTHCRYHGTTVYFTVPYRPMVPSALPASVMPLTLTPSRRLSEGLTGSIAMDPSKLKIIEQAAAAAKCTTAHLRRPSSQIPAPTIDDMMTTTSSAPSACPPTPLTLPLTPSTSVSSVAAAATTTKSTGKVLVVDDNRVNLKLAVRIVSKLGYETATAMNGQEAVDQFLSDPSIQLILMDKEMPVMDGLEAVREIRRIERERGADDDNTESQTSSDSSARSTRMAVVALTAAAYREDEDACLSSGCDAYLTKPVKRQDLQRVLESFWTLSIKGEDGLLQGETMAE